MIHRSLLALSVVSSVIYLVTPGVVWKGLAVAPLALVAFLFRQRLLGLALALGSLGDVLLDLSPSLFVAGLSAFLVGHIVYTVLCVRNWPRPLPLRSRALPLATLLLCMGALCAWLIPALGSMAVPVMFYMLAISAMASAAILTGYGWVALGAVLFVISDSLIGVGKFRAAVPYRDFLVWTTYYVAQLLIALGYLRAKKIRL